MRRFFINKEQIGQSTITLPAEESKHIIKVLRLNAGEKVELVDGSGSIYLSKIISTEATVIVEVISIRKDEPQKVQVRVAQGILKGQKMDLVVQKTNELGADLLIPYHSSRCQGKIDTSPKKRERWQKIALESCKQCMRPQPMQIISPVTFSDLIQESSREQDRLKLLFWEEEQQQSLHTLPPLQSFTGVDIILGTEGGITCDEAKLALQHGWKTVSLGKRILRAETAAISAITLVQYLSGNLS